MPKGLYSDLLALIVRGFAFIFLSKAVTRPPEFFAIYAALMLFDSLWLRYTCWLRTCVEESLLEDMLITIYRRRPPIEATHLWLVNNSCTFLFLALTYHVFKVNVISYHALFALGSVLCMLNCALDFYLTAWVYFPELDRHGRQKA